MSEFTMYYRSNVLSILKSRTDSEQDGRKIISNLAVKFSEFCECRQNCCHKCHHECRGTLESYSFSIWREGELIFLHHT